MCYEDTSIIKEVLTFVKTVYILTILETFCK